MASAISDRAFTRIVSIAAREAGIVLAESKVSMVKSRLSRRLRTLDIPSFDAYLDFLEATNDKQEMENFISALTTNVSHFFREHHHFDYLRTHILPHLRKKLAAGGKARIWSAGCSNGQEPYSIAMTILKEAPDLAKMDFKILATDIDPEVLVRAKSAQYFGSLTTGLTDATIKAFCTASEQQAETALILKPEVRNMVAFRQLNLHAEWPMKGKFDAIFCRNVVIYFDEEAQSQLFRRFAAILEPGGWLMLGHSERLSESTTPLFVNTGVTTYQTIQNTQFLSPGETQVKEGTV
ncbi:chemotaxis protein methyltransferase CheR [Celeribacter persicus]|uniref:Chemotaxis protein methyltransferase n=2 Tax=Celeribacter persicus TaxID=1651082 RepID=A0A2T5HK87_9RHOB|nr:chemotaxis protein methyltransferase CheR [Celeribacter persicus]